MDSIKNLIFGTAAIFSSFFMGINSAPVNSQPVMNMDSHKSFHYPQPSDLKEPVEPIPYLSLPFRKKDLEKNPVSKDKLYEITEGWVYSKEELAIHGGDPLHGGVDIHAPYGTTVVSPVDGFITSSYHTKWKRSEDGSIVMYKGEPIRLGIGYFVYIYVPAVQRFVEIAHLSEIDEKIPFKVPEKTEDGWDPKRGIIDIKTLKNNPEFVKIKKGDIIGKVGYSGLARGENMDYIEGAKRPVVKKQSEFQSWDEPHVHMEELWISQETGEKGWQRDPYAIYDTFEKYPTHNKKGPLGKDPLFILDSNNLPQFTE